MPDHMISMLIASDNSYFDASPVSLKTFINLQDSYFTSRTDFKLRRSIFFHKYCSSWSPAHIVILMLGGGLLITQLN